MVFPCLVLSPFTLRLFVVCAQSWDNKQGTLILILSRGDGPKEGQSVASNKELKEEGGIAVSLPAHTLFVKSQQPF
jgi:hypothetical protein